MNSIEQRSRSRTKNIKSVTLSAALTLMGAALLAAPSVAAPAGPVRMARFTVIEGSVNWRPDDHASWSLATRNLPVRQGCQIAAIGSGRGELQFDDGSRLQFGRNALVTFTTLYSDADGEFTELTLRDGTAAICLRKTPSVYQIDAPLVTSVASGPARIRIDAAQGVQVTVRTGKCVVQGDQGKATMEAGDYLDLRSKSDALDVRTPPASDSFDDWASGRCAEGEKFLNGPHHSYVPRNVGIVCGNLDAYGDWRTDKKYGHLWRPRSQHAGWRPYHDGDWTWVDPVGWTWVDHADWGWAPSHYGTWVNESDGWCWSPGPERQYWSPAVVTYCRSGNSVAWCPVAPAEVRYPPSVSVGFNGGDWSLYFSIGAAAAYYPDNGGYCRPRAWRNDYVNRITDVTDVTYVNNYYGGRRLDYGGAGFNRNAYFTNQNYVPYNARYAAGASLVAVNAFGRTRGGYRALPRDPRNVYAHARYIGAPAANYPPVAGPPAARRTAIALTPTRVLRPNIPIARTVFQRPVHRVAPIAQSPAVARRVMAQPPPSIRTAGGRRPASPAAAIGARRGQIGAPGAAIPGRPGTIGRPGATAAIPGRPGIAARPNTNTAAIGRRPGAITRPNGNTAVIPGRPGTSIRPNARNAAVGAVTAAAAAHAAAVRAHNGRPVTAARPGAAPGLTPAQQAAMRARTALGRPVNARAAGHNAAPPIRVSPATARTLAPHPAVLPTRPATPALTPAQRAAVQARTALGHRTGAIAATNGAGRPQARPARPGGVGSFAPGANRSPVTAGSRPSAVTARPGGRPANLRPTPSRPVQARAAAPQARPQTQITARRSAVPTNRPTVRQNVTSARRMPVPSNRPAAIRRSVPVRAAAQPARPRYQAPRRPTQARNYAPAVRQRSVAPRPSPRPSYTAPRRQYQAPRPSYTAPRRQYQAPRPSYTAPRRQYQAPRPSYTAPRTQYQAPVRRMASPAPRPQYTPRPAPRSYAAPPRRQYTAPSRPMAAPRSYAPRSPSPVQRPARPAGRPGRDERRRG